MQLAGRDHDRRMALLEHFRELRTRFFIVAVALLVASCLVYVFRDQIIPIILQPVTVSLGDHKLMYLNPAGGFNFIFTVSIYIGIAVTFPLLIQQVYGFIRPILPPTARHLSAMLLICSFLLLITGVAFGYYVAVPGALNFLGEFAGEYVSSALTADSYIQFLFAYILGLGLLFQLPLFLILFHYVKPLTPSGLLKSERWVIVLTVILAAIITPTPDPINLMLVAVPIIAIYQFGVIVVLFMIFRRTRHRTAVKSSAMTTVDLEVTTIMPQPLSPRPVATTSFNRSPRPAYQSSQPLVAAKPRPPSTIRLSQRTASSFRSVDGIILPVRQSTHVVR